MKIAVIGAGSVGGTLGRQWAQVGHRVHFGVPEPKKRKYADLVEEISGDASVHSIPQAAEQADVIVLATPWLAAQEAIVQLGDISGKLVIDATNPLKPQLAGLTVGHDSSGAEQVQGWAKGAKVFKAFNSTGWENMATPEIQGHKLAMFFAGDDAESRGIVAELVSDLGFEAIDAGPLSSARLLEPLALLWIRLAYVQGLGRDFGLALLRR